MTRRFGGLEAVSREVGDMGLRALPAQCPKVLVQGVLNQRMSEGVSVRRARCLAHEGGCGRGVEHVFGAADVDLLHVVGPSGAELVQSGGVIDDLDAVERLLHRRSVGDVAFGVLDRQIRDPPPVARRTDEHPSAFSSAAQSGGRPAAEETGRAGHE